MATRLTSGDIPYRTSYLITQTGANVAIQQAAKNMGSIADGRLMRPRAISWRVNASGAVDPAAGGRILCRLFDRLSGDPGVRSLNNRQWDICGVAASTSAVVIESGGIVHMDDNQLILGDYYGFYLSTTALIAPVSVSVAMYWDFVDVSEADIVKLLYAAA